MKKWSVSLLFGVRIPRIHLKYEKRNFQSSHATLTWIPMTSSKLEPIFHGQIVKKNWKCSSSFKNRYFRRNLTTPYLFRFETRCQRKHDRFCRRFSIFLTLAIFPNDAIFGFKTFNPTYGPFRATPDIGGVQCTPY